MSKCKSATKDFSAIYNLAFYKKQRNWKLRKENALEYSEQTTPSKTRHNLNETYSIDQECGGNSIALNDAFVATNSGAPQDIINRADCDSQDGPMWGAPEKYPRWSDPALDGANQGVNLWANSENAYGQVVSQQWGTEECHNSPEPFTQGEYQIRPGELLEADTAPDLDQLSCDYECSRSVSSVSCCGVTQFLRGAARAPHSSELDLAEMTHCTTDDPVHQSHVSQEQLSAAIERHVSALSDLLRLRTSMEQRPHSSHHFYHRNTSTYSCEERPTRDYGPTRGPNMTYDPTQTSYLYPLEPIVSGSHNPVYMRSLRDPIASGFKETYQSQYPHEPTNNTIYMSPSDPKDTVFKVPAVPVRPYRAVPLVPHPIPPPINSANFPAVPVGLNPTIPIGPLPTIPIGPLPTVTLAPNPIVPPNKFNSDLNENFTGYKSGLFKDPTLVPNEDPFIAGSYKNKKQQVGRGRGRLGKERVVEIRMGRPYRL